MRHLAPYLSDSRARDRLHRPRRLRFPIRGSAGWKHRIGAGQSRRTKGRKCFFISRRLTFEVSSYSILHFCFCVCCFLSLCACCLLLQGRWASRWMDGFFLASVHSAQKRKEKDGTQLGGTLSNYRMQGLQ